MGIVINIDLSEVIGWERVGMTIVIFFAYQVGNAGGHAAHRAVDWW